MTEQEIRQQVADTIQKWVGVIEGSVKHHEIIDTYNSYKPHPRGYAMTYKAPWCATTVSSVSILCKLTDIMPVECSCGQMIELYKKLGRWVENDKYAPKVGDVIFYDWKDGKNYKDVDNTTGHDHTGIVTEVKGNSFVVTEGNRKINGVNQVAYRVMEVNGRYIRGYGCPDYASKADKPKAPWYEASMERAKELGLLDGTRPLDTLTRAEAATIALRLYDLLS